MRSPHSYLPRFILLLLRTRLNSYKLSLLYIRASKAVSSVYHASSKSCTSMAEHTTACPRALLLTICIHHLLHLGIWGHDTPPTPVVADSKKNYSLRTLIDSHRSNIHLTLFMSQKLVVASVPISITVFSLGSIIIRKTGLRIDCRVVYIIFLSYLFLFFSCFTNTVKAFPFLPNAVWDSLDEIRWYCCQCVTGAIPGIFRSPGLRPNGVLECFFVLQI